MPLSPIQERALRTIEKSGSWVSIYDLSNVLKLQVNSTRSILRALVSRGVLGVLVVPVKSEGVSLTRTTYYRLGLHPVSEIID